MPFPIRVLDLTPVAHDERHRPRYAFHNPFPWLRTTEPARDTQDAAYADAREWVRKYEADDPYGNMGAALGVALLPEGGYVGVLGYFHSNT